MNDQFDESSEQGPPVQDLFDGDLDSSAAMDLAWKESVVAGSSRYTARDKSIH